MTTIRTVEHMNRLIVDHLHRIRQIPFDVIVHLPRSGTIPASLLATHLRKPLASVDEICAGLPTITRKTDLGHKAPNRLLLVDDSIRTGVQMRDAVARILDAWPKYEIRKFAVYDTPSPTRHTEADLTLQAETKDYAYPWFMWKTKKIENWCVDMDGVLCRDATKEEDDDGERYTEFMRTAEPRFLPSHPIGWIVTARLEKHREETIKQLRRHGVRHNRLIMGPWATNAERKKAGPGEWKAKIFSQTPATLFIESSERQAETIHRLTGRSVWCVDTQKAFQL